jgi:hypothetical protein
MEQSMPPRAKAGRLTVGLIILTLGVLMLVDRLNYFDISVMRLFPGMVLIALGLSRIALAQLDPASVGGGNRSLNPRPAGRADLRQGLWLMTVGTWLIVNAVHLFGLTYGTSWPLLLIAGGVFIVARGWEK